jgi:hypothetical protein
MNKKLNRDLWKTIIRNIILSAVGISHFLAWIILKLLFWKGDNKK